MTRVLNFISGTVIWKHFAETNRNWSGRCLQYIPQFNCYDTPFILTREPSRVIQPIPLVTPLVSYLMFNTTSFNEEVVPLSKSLVPNTRNVHSLWPVRPVEEISSPIISLILATPRTHLDTCVGHDPPLYHGLLSHTPLCSLTARL